MNRDIQGAEVTKKRLWPSYTHTHEAKGVLPSSLTLDTAKPVYDKLHSFLFIARQPNPPAGGWRDGNWTRSLFDPDGWHYPVRWCPKDRRGYRHLRFDEFLAFYAIEPFNTRLGREEK